MVESKKNIIYGTIGIILMCFSVFLVTYSWLNNKTSLSDKSMAVVEVDGLKIIYTKSSSIVVGNIKPGEVVEKDFTIKNVSTGAINYNINWGYVENNFNNHNNLVYTINNEKEKQCPDSGSNIPIMKNITIEKNASHTYKLVIKHKNNGKRKNTNLFEAKLDVSVNTE